MTHLDPTTRYVRSLEGTYYMVREAAEILGVRHTRLRDLLRNDPELGPSYCTYLGKIKIYLYTPDDITRLRRYLSTKKVVMPRADTINRVGRPSMWTEAQRKERQRKYSSNYYYRQRAARLRASGSLEAAQVAEAKAEAIAAELEAMEPYSVDPE